MSRSKAASRRSTTPTGCWRMSAAATPPSREIAPAQIESQLSLAVDRVMAEGSLYDPRSRRAGDQAGARRPDRGDLPRPRLPHDPAAPRPVRADRDRRDGHPPASLGDLQGPARRAGARADLRLHPPPDRFRARRGRRAPSPRRGAGRSRDGDAARDRSPRRRRADRAGKRTAPRRRRRRPDARAARLPRRPRPPPAGAGARRRRLSSSPSATRPSAASAARIPSSARSASARSRSRSCPPSSAFAVPLGRIQLTECQMVNQFHGTAEVPPQFTRGYGLVFGQSERKAMSMALVDRALRAARARRGDRRAGAGRGIRPLPLRQRPGDRLRRASEAAALRRFPGRARRWSACCAPNSPNGQPQPTATRRGRRRNERADGHRGKRLQLRLSRRADEADDPPRDPQGDRHSRLPGALRQPRDADALWLGHRRRPGHRRDHRAGRRAEGDRPGLRRHHQRGLDPQVLRQDRGRRDDDRDRGGDHHPDAPPHSGSEARPTTRSSSSRCRSPSRSASSSRARPRRASCMRSPTTASCM